MQQRLHAAASTEIEKTLSIQLKHIATVSERSEWWVSKCFIGIRMSRQSILWYHLIHKRGIVIVQNPIVTEFTAL